MVTLQSFVANRLSSYRTLSVFAWSVFVGLTFLATTVDAEPTIAPPLAKDPVMEAKVMEIAKDLRCLVCQNETIAGSHADLAIDLRQQIQDQLAAGKSRSEIMQYMVDRYGDFILYNPPVKSTTMILWLGPFLLMLIGLFTLRKFRKKSIPVIDKSSYTEQDLSKARAMLESKELLKKDSE